MGSASAFLEARDLLLEHHDDYETAYREFAWPRLGEFNWALDYFDAFARGNDRAALWVVHDDGLETKLSFSQMSRSSDSVANWLRAKGVRRGDRILVMLSSAAPLWEITLAAMKLGAVVSPAHVLLTEDDIRDRVERGGIKHVVVEKAVTGKVAGIAGDVTRVVVGGEEAGWLPLEEAYDYPDEFDPHGATRADDPLILYFTSGTTAKPKMVVHTHQSYPVGHLSTMYWLGLQRGDVHLNVGSPGWAKHAWSSFFAPWNAEATVFIYNSPRFDAKELLQTISRCGVTTVCAPPTVWRFVIQEDLGAYSTSLRRLCSAGEPLNPEVIERVRDAWNLTIHDGYGQTETTALVGNPPAQPVKSGSMGRPLPGYRISVLGADGEEAEEGEFSVGLKPEAPVGLMAGYADDPERTDVLLGGDYYRTSDVGYRDPDGYYWYVGRTDDVFKSSDYRISPFELESVLIEHEAIAEAAVVPSPDPTRLYVPKAYVTLRQGFEPSRETALSVFRFSRARLAPYKRVRRLEIAELPKTISGKIRRVELRVAEAQRQEQGVRGEYEFWEKDFSELERPPSAPSN